MPTTSFRWLMVDDLTNEVKGGFDDRALAVSFANARGWRIVENVLIDITGELKLDEQSATLDGEAIVGVLLDAYEESLPTTVTKHSHNLGLVRIIVRPYAPPPSEDDQQQQYQPGQGQEQTDAGPPDFDTVNKQNLANLSNLVRPPASTSTSATAPASASASSKSKPKPASRPRSSKPGEPLG